MQSKCIKIDRIAVSLLLYSQILSNFARNFNNQNNLNNKYNMKKVLLSLFTIATAMTATADGLKAGYSSVEIRTVSGETTTVTLSDDMTTQFTAQDIVFADATTTVTLPLAQLRTYTFVEAVIPEGITDVTAVQGNINAIYTADGRQITSLEGAPAGLYIVKSAGTTIKIYRK